MLFGRRFGRILYLVNGLLAILIALPLTLEEQPGKLLIMALFFTLFIATWLEMGKREGRALNATLGHTARNVFLFALLLAWLLFSHASAC